jgi:hypothetical protein
VAEIFDKASFSELEINERERKREREETVHPQRRGAGIGGRREEEQ